MKWLRVAVGAIAVWLVALIVIDRIYGAQLESQIGERAQDTLEASATFGDVDVALVRGELAIDQLAVSRKDAVGSLSLTVDTVRCDLPPLGIAIASRDCRVLTIRGVRLEVSAISLFHMHPPKRAPLRVDRLVLDDAELAFAPSAILPELGRVALHIDHAEADATVLRTPLSWLFALDHLRATLSLPAGIRVILAYDAGELAVSGSLFGSSPVSLPVKLPVASSFATAHDEAVALARLAKTVAEKLVARRAEDWLRQKLGR